MKNKRIVILSNYYPPEMGAAANRIQNMAEGLRDKGYDITVICPLANYPEGKIFKEYKGRFIKTEIINGIDVRRYWIFPSISKNKFLRFFSMLSFAISLWFSLGMLLKVKPRLMIVQSPPLFVAFSGLLLSKVVRCKKILNVSDLWPLSGLELGLFKKGVFYSVLERIEKKNYKWADAMMGQSEETAKYIQKKASKGCMVYRNVPPKKESPAKQKGEVLKIVYAGLLGYAQGILGICKSLKFNELEVEIHIYGAGMEESEIINFAKKSKSAVFFHGMVAASKIKDEIAKYDVGLVSLSDRIYGAVPSKIFELIQPGIPILFSGEGEGAEIVEKEGIGLCSNSKDYEALKKNILRFNSMKNDEYRALSAKCIEVHLKKYNMNLEMDKLYHFVKKMDI